MDARTINFQNSNIVKGLTSIAQIKFGYPEYSKFRLEPTNNPLVNRALEYLVGMPAGPYRYIRCMYKINLANTTYSYIIGGISDESFREFLKDYNEKDKWFWYKNDNFNTIETKLLTA